jgi:AmpD protein
MALDSGWLTGCRRVPSPNADERPPGVMPSLLVIHNISLPPGQFGGGEICDFFQNCLDHEAHPYFDTIRELQVSAHLLIDRAGLVTQFVPFHQRAWHAGVSCFQGQERCNDFSIGIELEGTDTVPYTDEQYQALADVARCLVRAYPAILPERVVGHCDIAPGRKTDPGPSFDWHRFRHMAELTL